jgi:hypothetical protein
MAPMIARSSAALVAILLMLTAGANADETADAPSLVLSNGIITCGDFLADNRNTQELDASWVLGYISGRNRNSPDGYRTAGSSYTTSASITAWLQNYCRGHALDRLFMAGEELRNEFLRREAKR